MKRFFLFFITVMVMMTILLCGCDSDQIDRSKELKKVMDTCDSKWSQAFPTGTASFDQVADYIAGWGGNAGMEITKKAEHYIVLTNPATKKQKDVPSITVAVSIDPLKLRDGVPHLSLGMTSLLGPVRHGTLRLIVTEVTDDMYPGAEAISGKYLKCDHFIYLYNGGSATVYTEGPLSSQCSMRSEAGSKKPSYNNAFRLTLKIPDRSDPYTFEKQHAIPNPINVLGDLLASAKSSGRLYEIASFTAEDNGDFMPAEASAVIVVDDNSVESIQSRFEKSYESFEKKFNELELETDEDGNPLESFSYTMEPVPTPEKVLKHRAADNIISLMYTLQTGIHLQDEETGSITAASYIRSVSTDRNRFSLVMDLRSRNEDAMEEMSGNYLVTSGLCDVSYDENKSRRLWTSADDSSAAAWFTATVNEEDTDITRLQSSECDKLYDHGIKPDMISYRYDEDHRDTALENMITYLTSITETD